MKTGKLLIVTSALLALVAAASATPTVTLTVGLTDSHAIGDIINGIQAGGQVDRDVTMINNLISVAANGTQYFDGEQYQRTSLAGPFPTAVAAGAVPASGGGLSFNGNSVELTTTSAFRYLIAAYDGPNGGVEVWDISSFAGGTTFSVPRYAHPLNEGGPGPGDETGPLVADTYYQMTGWTLMNPTTTPDNTPGVPDGGATALLLCGGLAALSVGRRFINI